MNANGTSAPVCSGRVIGMDLHPDIFSAAALAGRDAATAKVEQHWDQRPIAELEKWGRTLRAGDLVVRVAGYSDFFVRLSRDLQNYIIGREKHAVAG